MQNYNLQRCQVQIIIFSIKAFTIKGQSIIFLNQCNWQGNLTTCKMTICNSERCSVSRIPNLKEKIRTAATSISNFFDDRYMLKEKYFHKSYLIAWLQKVRMWFYLLSWMIGTFIAYKLIILLHYIIVKQIFSCTSHIFF